MRSAMTVCTAVFSAFAWLGAQDAGVTSIQVGFLRERQTLREWFGAARPSSSLRTPPLARIVNRP
jgi:hypothetical protein